MFVVSPKIIMSFQNLTHSSFLSRMVISSSSTFNKQEFFVSKPYQAKWDNHLDHPSSTIVKIILSQNKISFVKESRLESWSIPYPISTLVYVVHINMYSTPRHHQSCGGEVQNTSTLFCSVTTLTNKLSLFLDRPSPSSPLLSRMNQKFFCLPFKIMPQRINIFVLSDSKFLPGNETILQRTQ